MTKYIHYYRDTRGNVIEHQRSTVWLPLDLIELVREESTILGRTRKSIIESALIKYFNSRKDQYELNKTEFPAGKNF